MHENVFRDDTTSLEGIEKLSTNILLTNNRADLFQNVEAILVLTSVLVLTSMLIYFAQSGGRSVSDAFLFVAGKEWIEYGSNFALFAGIYKVVRFLSQETCYFTEATLQ